MSFIRALRDRFLKANHLYKVISVALLALIIGLAVFLSISYLTTPSYTILNPQQVSDTTELFPTTHHAYVDHNSSTGVIVEIFGENLPNDAWLTVVTERWGTDVPSDAGAPLVVDGAVPAYYDVKVTANVTFVSDVLAKVTLTHQNFNENCVLYYFNSTLDEWVSVTTDFQSPHTIIGTFPALALTGTPLGVGDSGPNASPTPTSTPVSSPTATPPSEPTPTPSASPASTLTPTPTATPTTTPSPSLSPPPFVVPESNAGALLALLACVAAFLIIVRIRK
jgi:hypothetical protein